jgi:DNA primase
MNALDIAKLTNTFKSHKAGYLCQCPAHEDSTPSLHICDKDDKVLVKCFAGCDAESIVRSLGLGLKDLFHQSDMTPMEKRNYAKKSNQVQLTRALGHELSVMQQFVAERVCDETLSKDTRYLSNHPEFKPMPPEPWAREILAAKTIKKLLGDIYG